MKLFNLRFPDLGLFIPALLISIYSLVVIISISPDDFKSQLAFLCIGIGLCFILTQIDIELIFSLSWLGYIAMLIVLILTLLISDPTRGARSWLTIGPWKIQPSEFAKPILIVFLSQLPMWLFARKLRHFLGILGLALIPIFFIFLQPDLGTIIPMAISSGAVILALHPKKRFLLALVVIAMISLPIVWQFLKPYQKIRVMTFTGYQKDPLGSSYNQIQSEIAIGSGQILGRGLGKGTQSQLKFLPEKHTDFIYAALGEEFGFLGTSLLIGLFLILAFRFMYLASMAERIGDIALFLGMMTLLLSQFLVHSGINLGILPVTGITLPFMSVGGSSLISSWLAIGISSSLSYKLNKSEVIFLE